MLNCKDTLRHENIKLKDALDKKNEETEKQGEELKKQREELEKLKCQMLMMRESIQ